VRTDRDAWRTQVERLTRNERERSLGEIFAGRQVEKSVGAAFEGDALAYLMSVYKDPATVRLPLHVTVIDGFHTGALEDKNRTTARQARQGHFLFDHLDCILLEQILP
jgi:hypothetical protein